MALSCLNQALFVESYNDLLLVIYLLGIKYLTVLSLFPYFFFKKKLGYYDRVRY